MTDFDTRRQFLTGAALGIAGAAGAVPSNAQAPTATASDAEGSVRRFGAIGDGASGRADQAGLAAALDHAQRSGHYIAGVGNSYWAHPQDGLFLPAGVYDAGDLRIAGNRSPSPSLSIWAIPGSVVLRIPEDEYLFVCDERLNRFHASGITFVGGKGAFQHRFAGDSVAGLVQFRDCIFDDYTECAIGNNARDAPYLRVRDCTFMARAGAPAIGIAWGGLSDNSIVEANAFLRNRYHLKLGPDIGGSVHVLRNDFINWGGTERAADIWFVPNTRVRQFGTNSGQGSIVAGNKFGNEHAAPSDVRILVAIEGDGADRQTRHHATRFVGGGSDGAYVTGIAIRDNRISANAQTAAPLIRSHIAELRALSYTGNRHDGGRHSWLCEFMGPRPGDYANTDWSIEIGAGEGAPFRRGLTNAIVGPIADPAGLFGTADAVMLAPSGGDDIAHLTLVDAQTTAAFKPYVSAIVAAAPDAAGHSRAAEVRVGAAGGGIAIPLLHPRGGRQTWLAADLKGEGEAIVEVFNHVDGRTAAQACFPLPAEWRRIRMAFVLPEGGGEDTWQFRIRPPGGGAGQFLVARAQVYHGREPMRDGHLRTLGDGKWDGGHLVMGTTHIWEHDGRLFMKVGGVPASPTDGVAIGS